MRGEYRWGATTNKATLHFDYLVTCSSVTNKKQYIFTSTRSIGAKLAKLVTYNERSQNLVTWDHKTNENVISHFLESYDEPKWQSGG